MVFAFDPTYTSLPAVAFARVAPTPVAAPSLLALNTALADLLGVDANALRSAEGVEILAGNRVLEGSEPLALAYAGHQFGHFVPQLGDGRAVLLGEVLGKDGRRYDIQLKGAGRTPFSRGGDGRAALGPVLREYVMSEAMAALGVPTTRALAAVATGEPVFRSGALPGAVLTRVAASHLRIGTFQYLARTRDREAILALTSYALARHYPDVSTHDGPALALFDAVMAAQASLVARWLGLGFVHGVMNTDNTSISGETIDYGPCAFLDAYSPDRSFSSIDQNGRYAFGKQPGILRWNLARLAEALLPLVDDGEDRAVARFEERLATFPDLFAKAYATELRRKLGLTVEREGDPDLFATLLGHMASSRVDYTLCFRRLSEAALLDSDASVAELFQEPRAFLDWAKSWRARLAEEPISPEQRSKRMGHANPAFIPRNHQVEAMIEAALKGDLGPFERLNRVLARPYEEQPDASDLAEPPGKEQWLYQTFCGT